MTTGFKFEDNSREVKQQMRNAGEAGMEAALLVIEASAKANAPVDLGELRDTLDHTVGTEAGTTRQIGNTTVSSSSQIIGTVGSPKDYAIYVEYGTGEFAENGAGRKGGWSYKDEKGIWHHTKGQKPQPYLRPAFKENKKNIQDIIGKEYSVQFKGSD